MSEMINKWEVVDKLTNLENKLQRYKPFTKHEYEMYHKICRLEIEIGKTSGVELIRCKDCKYIMFSDCYGECGAGNLGIVRPDDFCIRGERKDSRRQ